MLLQPIFEGGEDNPPALGFGATLEGHRVRVRVLWVGVTYHSSNQTIRLHTNETEHQTLQVVWKALEQGTHEGVIFDVIQT